MIAKDQLKPTYSWLFRQTRVSTQSQSLPTLICSPKSMRVKTAIRQTLLHRACVILHSFPTMHWGLRTLGCLVFKSQRQMPRAHSLLGGFVLWPVKPLLKRNGSSENRSSLLEMAVSRAKVGVGIPQLLPPSYVNSCQGYLLAKPHCTQWGEIGHCH